ncbi:MAG: hypothetical protein [Bacteriophage sp.]|jgi:hypothetical protein|nr:MAG: hypothetical protein [Bacteriophage sp.]
MIYIGDKPISAVYWGEKAISAVYVGARLVWTAISSCFGAGFWQSEKPWKGADGWKHYKR